MDENLCNSITQKKKAVLDLFKECDSPEKLYHKLIELGQRQKKLPEEAKKPDTLVSGCQSEVYLLASLENGKVIFQAEADAMISAGLAFLLIEAYSDEPPEAILKCPPDHLEALKLDSALTPGRSNGLRSIFLKMQKEALRLLV